MTVVFCTLILTLNLVAARDTIKNKIGSKVLIALNVFSAIVMAAAIYKTISER